jgi:type VII secretion protein EccB
MQSKRDQVQAHTFMLSRLTSGMLLAEPDAPESPLARTARGVLVGVVISALIAAGALIYGFLSPGGNDSWRTPDSLIINKETGARYVYTGGRLRPVRNYATALLLGGGNLQTVNVGTASLRGTPVGAPVGIPGAPDTVPAAGDLDSGAWRVCSTVTTGSTDASHTASSPHTTLLAGAPASDEHGLGSGRGVLVSGPDKATYLAWQGKRMKLDATSGAAGSLGYGSVQPRPVSAAFLDALVPGPDLKPPAVPGLGSPGPALGGRSSTVGQVFQVRVPGSAAQYYMLQREGLAPLNDTQAALALGDPAIRSSAYGGASPKAAVLGADDLKRHLAPGDAGRSPSGSGLPDSPPNAAAVADDSALCARVLPGHGGTEVSTTLLQRDTMGPVVQPPSEDVSTPCLRVDATVVQPGHGALVKALSASGKTVGTTLYLVTDAGEKYLVPSQAALSALGYGQNNEVALPAPLLSMLPSGPDLDPAAASGAQPAHRPADCGGAPGGPGGPGGPKASTAGHTS